MRSIRPSHVLAASLVLGTFSHAAAPQEWGTFRGPNHDGVIPAPESVKNWKSVPLKKEWKTETEGGFSSFAVANMGAYTLVTREADGNKGETLVCLDAVKGKEKWSAALSVVPKYDDGGDAGTKENKGGDGARSTPVVAGGKVYAIDSFLVAWCFDAATGKQVWKHDVIADNAGRNIQWQNAASPLIEGDLFFMAGGGDGQALLALNKDTGKEVWKAEDDKMTHATPIATTIHGERQVIFFTQKGLVSVVPASGKVLWRAEHPYKVSTAASPVVWEDIVYCSSGYGVGASCFKIAKGDSGYTAESIWRREGQCFNHWSTPVAKDGYLYGMFSFKEYGKGPLGCVDIRTGKDVWSEPGFGPGQVVLAGSTLIATSDQGELVFVNASSEKYDELKRDDVMDGKVWSYPVVAYDHVYARSTTEGGCWSLK
jgi:outer membrane protein assembly factor BamB